MRSGVPLYAGERIAATDALSRPRWHDGAIDDLTFDGRPVVWSVATNGPIAGRVVADVPQATEDPADAAPTRNGTERRLRHRLARALIARLAEMDPAHIRLSRTPHGALVVGPPAGWHLSLSGRSGACLIGVALQPIAVDREPFDESPPLRDMLAPSEVAALDRLTAADRPRAWLRRWTIKEAHAKLVGEPLRIAPEAIETDIVDATHATATFEGVSECWTRVTATAVETVATWA